MMSTMKEWLEQYRVGLLVALVAAVLTGLVAFRFLKPNPGPLRLETVTPPPTPSPEATPTPRPLRVYVSGAVQVPEVYALPPDSIVKDALTAAGGPSAEADLDRINLASPLADGQHVYVPHLGEEDPPVQPPSSQRSGSLLVNINTADAATLETLPGIGPTIAGSIIDYRQANGPFGRIEEIVDVSGIGPATFEKIKELISTD
jgi:competence protein ComEA